MHQKSNSPPARRRENDRSRDLLPYRADWKEELNEAFYRCGQALPSEATEATWNSGARYTTKHARLASGCLWLGRFCSSLHTQDIPRYIRPEILTSDLTIRCAFDCRAMFCWHSPCASGPLPNQLRLAPDCEGKRGLSAAGCIDIFVEFHGMQLKRFALFYQAFRLFQCLSTSLEIDINENSRRSSP